MRPQILRLALLFSAFTLSSSVTRGVTYPQLALGGGYECVVIVSNMTDKTSDTLVMRLRQGNRDKWSGSWTLDATTMAGTDFRFKLAPRETRRYVLRGDSSARAGYLEILRPFGDPPTYFEPTDVAISFFYNFYGPDANLLDSTGTPKGDSSTKFVFGVEKSAKINTGLAAAPAAPIGASDQPIPAFGIRFTLFDAAGNTVAIKSVNFNGHFAMFFDELFSGVPTNFHGSVLVESSETSITLTILRLELTPTGFQLTSVPPSIPPPS